MNYQGVLKQHASTVKLALYVSDWLAIGLAARFAYWFYLGDEGMPERYLAAILIGLLLAGVFFPRFGLYQTWRSGSIIDEVKNISLAWGALLLGLMTLAFTTKLGAEYSRGWLASWAVFGWIFLMVGRAMLRFVLRLARAHGFNQRHIVIVGGADLGSELVARISAAPWMGLNVVGFFRGDETERGDGIPGVPSLGKLEDVAQFVQERDVDQVWIAMALRDEEKVQWILHELRHSTVDIRFIPDMFGMRLLNHSVMDLSGLPVLNLSISPMSGVNMLLKAIEDRVLALVILLLISPIMLIIAIGVKLSSPGPVFYLQERVGWSGRTFNMLKFRSMPVDTEKGGVQWGGAQGKTTTKFGSFIRKSSLDELPQFINVLRGDMSIVGPRPERSVFVERFKDEIPGYMKKHMVKAGITGWAQINGWRGDTDLEKRIEYDL